MFGDNELLLSAWNILAALRVWDDDADAIALAARRCPRSNVIKKKGDKYFALLLLKKG